MSRTRATCYTLMVLILTAIMSACSPQSTPDWLGGTEDATRRGARVGRLACTVAAGELKPEQLAMAKSAAVAVQGILQTNPTVQQLTEAMSPLPAKARLYTSTLIVEVTEELGDSEVIQKDSVYYVMLDSMLAACLDVLNANLAFCPAPPSDHVAMRLGEVYVGG